MAAQTTEPRTPILVELFTSEGCSSCPPADRLLEKLDLQPLPGAEIIVLSEHVDYWNHIGWKDPFSRHLYSERQNVYAQRFHLDSAYTPQIVVDGTTEFVGSDSQLADAALKKARGNKKLSVRVSSVWSDGSVVHAHLEIGEPESALNTSDAGVYMAIALNHAESQVSAGENAGHKLTHVSVAENIVRIGALKRGHAFAQDVELKLQPGTDVRSLRVIAFVQDSGQGRVLGAASNPVSTN